MGETNLNPEDLVVFPVPIRETSSGETTGTVVDELVNSSIHNQAWHHNREAGWGPSPIQAALEHSLNAVINQRVFQEVIGRMAQTATRDLESRIYDSVSYVGNPMSGNVTGDLAYLIDAIQQKGYVVQQHGRKFLITREENQSVVPRLAHSQDEVTEPWVTDEVLRLFQEIRNKNFSVCPSLADKLEEDGCRETVLLDLLRDPLWHHYTEADEWTSFKYVESACRVLAAVAMYFSTESREALLRLHRDIMLFNENHDLGKATVEIVLSTIVIYDQGYTFYDSENFSSWLGPNPSHSKSIITILNYSRQRNVSYINVPVVT